MTFGKEMKIDPHNFFHEGTMRICSSLDIQESVVRCCDFLKNYIPIDGIDVNIYDPDIKSLRIVAFHGKMVEHIKSNQLIPLSSQSVAFIQKRISELDSVRKVLLAKKYNETPISKDFWKTTGLRAGSAMALHLVVGDEKLGVVVVYSLKEDIFTQDHADLLELLHDPFAIALSNALRHHEVLRLHEMLNDDNRFLRQELHSISGNEIIGQNFGLREVMEMVQQVSALDSTVLLMGETGVGKEVIANAIHYSSPRSQGPMIKVNCGAIPETIMDSELFGHEKGAFTGAFGSKRGRFERANNGTIFLDEVAELSFAAQVRLLRVLQTKEIERVGGQKTIPVNVRVISATHRNLQKMVQDGDFREDLWFRLNVFPIIIPPLRMRKIDIPALAAHFIERKAKELNLTYTPVPSPDAIERLQEYDWPGNVRELENTVERELIRTHAQGKGKLLDFSDFSTDKTAYIPEPALNGKQKSKPKLLDDVVKDHILEVMDNTKGKIQGQDGAAAQLGLHPSTLRNRMRKLGIPFGREKS